MGNTEIALTIFGGTLGIVAAIALIILLYRFAIGKLVKGLRCFGEYAAQWESDDEVKVNVMKSLALISDGFANFILFAMIIVPIIALIVALAS